MGKHPKELEWDLLTALWLLAVVVGCVVVATYGGDQ